MSQASPLPLRYLIPLLLAAFSLSAVLLGYLSGEREMARIVLDEEEMHLRQQMVRNQETLETLLGMNDLGVVRLYVASFGADRQNSLTFLADGAGQVTASTRMAMIGQAASPAVPELNPASLAEIARTGGTVLRISDDEETIDAYTQICGPGEDSRAGMACGFFYRRIDIRYMMAKEKGAALRQAYFSGLGIVTAGFLVAFLLNAFVTRRTARMITVAERFAGGEREARILETAGGDELALLGRAFDRMLDRIVESETSMRESERRLAGAQAIAHLGNWTWDIPSGRLSWSDEVFRIFGYVPGTMEATYGAFLERIHPEDRERVERAIEESVARGTPYSMEHRIVTPGGEVRHVDERGLPTVDGSGAVIGMTGTVQDITERVTAMEEMELYRMMIEKSGDPVFLIDDDDGCRMIYVNEAAVRHYGTTREEILKWRIPDWDPNFSYENLPAHVEEVKKIRNLMIETTHQVKDGRHVPVEISLNCVQYRGRTCHFGYFKDISERKRVQQELVEAKETAESANRAKSQFLASMSHELRTPMNAILGFAQLLEYNREGNLTASQKEFIEDILKAGHHLLELIDEVLDLARIESGKLMISMEDVDLHQAVRAAIALVAPMAAERGISLESHCNCPGRFIRADLTRLKQVLMNLLSNAVKYNREGGRATLRCENPGQGRWRIWVEDTGAGIPPENLNRLFVPFDRLGAEGSNIQGTGIGLTITKRLVELMGGEIGVESTVGEGSRFFVEFMEGGMPGIPGGELPQQEKRPAAEWGAEKKVLYVEDNPANLRLVAGIMKHRPALTLLAATEAETGIELARSECPDLILLDINLPGLNGFDILKILRKDERTAAIPIVAVSANAMAEDISRAWHAGLTDYISKTFDMARFLAILDLLLET